MNEKSSLCSYRLLAIIFVMLFASSLVVRDHYPQIAKISSFSSSSAPKKELYPGHDIMQGLNQANHSARVMVGPAVFTLHEGLLGEIYAKNRDGTKQLVKKISLPIGVGTCFAISAKGYFLTADHVIEIGEASRDEIGKKIDRELKAVLGSIPNNLSTKILPEYYITGSDGSVLTVEVVKSSAEERLALIRVVDSNRVKFKTVAFSNRQLSDQMVFIIGAPRSLMNIVMVGKIARAEAEVAYGTPHLLLVGPITYGNSGGPVIGSEDMKVVGVVDVIFNTDIGQNTQIAGMIPLSTIATFLQKALPKAEE